MDKLIDPYGVAASTKLENTIFHVNENTYIDVNVEKLNDILSVSAYTKANKDIENNNLNLIKKMMKNEV